MSSNENILVLLYDMCRLCLERVGRYNLFSHDYTEIIAECAGVQVTLGDELPQSICEVCVERLNVCKELRTLAKQCDVRLRLLRDSARRPTTESDTECEIILPEILMTSPEDSMTINEPSSHTYIEREQTVEETSPHVPRIRVRVDIFDGQQDKGSTSTKDLAKTNQIEGKSTQQIAEGSKNIVSQFFTGSEALLTKSKRCRIDSEMCALNRSKGDTPLYYIDLLDDDSTEDECFSEEYLSEGFDSDFEEDDETYNVNKLSQQDDGTSESEQEMDISDINPAVVEVEEITADEEVDVAEEVDVTEEVNVAKQANVPKDVDVAKQVDVPKEIDVARKVDVPKDLNVAREVDVAKDLNVATQVDVSKELYVAGEVAVAKEVGVAKHVDVSKEINVARKADVPKELDVTREIDVAMLVDVAKEIDVATEVDVAKQVDVSKEVDVATQIDVAKEHHEAGEVDVAKQLDVARKVDVATQIDVAKELHVTGEVDVAMELNVAREVDVAKQFDVAKEVDVATQVNVAKDLSGEVHVDKEVDMAEEVIVEVVVEEMVDGDDANPAVVEDEEVDVAKKVAERYVEGDACNLAEEFIFNEDPTFNIVNLPVVYLNEDGNILPLEEPMNVDVIDPTAENPLFERSTRSEVDGENHDSGNVNSGNLDDGIDEQMDLDLLDEEWLPDERYNLDEELLLHERRRATAQRGARARGRPRLNIHDDLTCVRKRNCGLARGRGSCTAKPRDREWKKGDRLVGVYATDEDIPDKLREQLDTHKGRASARQANTNDAIDDERSDSGVIGDVMKEYEIFCKSDAARFEWKPMASFQGVKEQFQVDRAGPTRVFQSAYDAFREYWDDAILQHIVDATNAYGDAVPVSEISFHKNWYHTNSHEILMLFAFWIMLGVMRMPSLNSCFSNDVLLKTNVFRMMFTKGRYWTLNRAIRFAPNETLEQNPDKLRHIRPILNHLNSKFKECYVPSQNICIDESLTLWKGKLSFRQYLRAKAAKFGIKTYELCESSSGYLWSFFIYTGKSPNTELLASKTVQTVLTLIGPLLGKGYQVFMDNFFNSPLLARFLKTKQTDCVGTVRKTRKDIPPLISTQILPPGSYMARHADNVVLLSQTDRRPFIMISTHHGTEQFETRERLGRKSEYKFAAVSDYNQGMGGIDKKDQMLESSLVERKQCKRWFKKCFKRLLNVTVLNSRILVEKSSGNARSHLIFRMELLKDILQKHMNNLPRLQKAPVPRGDIAFPVNRIICDESRFHCIKRIELSERCKQGSNRSVSRRCRWCRIRGHVRARTSYECSICKIPLCIDPCFKKFHTQR